jgi:hypothetical protein
LGGLLADSPPWPTLNQTVLPRNLHNALLATQVVGFLTLLRSVAFERWITVLGAMLLVGGATAALRGRTWGVALSLLSAAAFPVAWAVGIAPFWFVFVGLVGALPFYLSAPALRRVDRQATGVLATLAVLIGGAVAVTWRVAAWDIFSAFPAVWPSRYAQNGWVVLALLAAGVAAFVAQGLGYRRAPVRVASGERVRVGEPAYATSHEAELEAQAHEEAHLAARRR